jgi:hypothetical protein
VSDTKNPPTAGHDMTPSMAYSDTVPASGAPDRQTPAPWVPFTRAGCTVGDFSTANMVLENVARDIPAVFGPNSPEAAQAAADPDSFKDAEVADYIGVAVHCAQGDATCANAQAVKFGQTTPSPTARDSLPTEPGGYTLQGLFGAVHAPQLGAGTPNLFHQLPSPTRATRRSQPVEIQGAQPDPASPADPTATQHWPPGRCKEAGIGHLRVHLDLHERRPRAGARQRPPPQPADRSVPATTAS